MGIRGAPPERVSELLVHIVKAEIVSERQTRPRYQQELVTISVLKLLPLRYFLPYSVLSLDAILSPKNLWQRSAP